MVLARLYMATSLVAFDCNQGRPNITTVSLLEIEECQQNIKTLRETEEYIQLVQTADYAGEHVYQCKISIQRHVTYCGMHSHASEVRGGHGAYILEVGKQACMDLHRYRKYQFQHNILIDGLKHNATIQRSSVIAGSISYDGSCSGSDYSDQFGSWSNVVVQAIISITLADYEASTNLKQNIIRLRSGTVCPYLEYNCIDSEGGETYWNQGTSSQCDVRKYMVLYEGPAVSVTAGGDNRTVYTVTTQDTTFALSVLSDTFVCSHHAFQTEHPKLLIIVGTKGRFVLRKSSIIPLNMDIFTYVNSKLVYVEKHVSREMTSLYIAVQNQRCELERQVLRNLLNLAIIAPEQFAYNFKQGPGFTAVSMGEVVHIIQCVPVDVQVRKTAECYNELPVTYLNKSLFVTPRSRILLSHGTQVDCNPLTAPIYQLYGAWYKLNPDIIETTNPNTLTPSKTPKWTYTNAGQLAISGIYSLEELERLAEQIMFPSERQAITNTIARSITGKTTNLQGLNLHYAFTAESMNRIVTNYAKKVWGWFYFFGNITSGFIGIWIGFKILKFAIDTVIHGWSLYRMFGFGIHLLGSFWGTVTNVMLHVLRPKNEDKSKSDEPTPYANTERDANVVQGNERDSPTSSSEETPTTAEGPYNNVVIQLKAIPSNDGK